MLRPCCRNLVGDLQPTQASTARNAYLNQSNSGDVLCCGIVLGDVHAL